MTIAGSDVLEQTADGTSIFAMSVPVKPRRPSSRTCRSNWRKTLLR